MMKKPHILLFSFVMAALVLTSCEEEYMVNTGDFESELVVNSLFNNDSPWLVKVSNTFNILDKNADPERLENAKVEIFDQNDEFLYELYHDKNGEYKREDYGPSPKRGYSIKVSAIGYSTVTAKSFVPEKSTLLINNFSIIPNEKYNDVEVDFEIEDRSDLESYYIWEIVNIESEDGGSANAGTNQLSDTWIDDLTNDPSGLINDGKRDILEGGSFGDGTYNGTYSTIDGNRRIGRNPANAQEFVNYVQQDQVLGKLDPDDNGPKSTELGGFFNEDIEDENGGGKRQFKYELRVMSISKELYDYYSSVEEYLKKSENNHSNQIPYHIYTNISKGYGVFAGYSESVLQF